jgi:uncharacterized integral membrane protein (TIGR00697 family)
LPLIDLSELSDRIYDMLALSIIIIALIVVILGAIYARKSERPDGLIGLYITFTLASQLIAVKIAEFDFIAFKVTAPAAVFIFAVTFLITDLVNERYGQAETHRMIFIALAAQVAFSVFLIIGGALPAAPFWTAQEAWQEILGVVPRIMLASWVTFLITENLDAYLFARLRRLTQGRHVWARNAGSSFVSLTIDTVVFISLAFYGTGLPLISLMLGQFAIKYTVVIMSVPFMYLGRAVMGSGAVNIQDTRG